MVLVERYIRRKFGYLVNIKIYSHFKVNQKKITLLKSPFVHKIAQEQFLIQNFSKHVLISLNIRFDSISLFY
jgi:hypothetical protein